MPFRELCIGGQPVFRGEWQHANLELVLGGTAPTRSRDRNQDHRWLRECRESLDLTQDEFAEALGVPRTWVGQYERGTKTVPEVVCKAALDLVTRERVEDFSELLSESEGKESSSDPDAVPDLHEELTAGAQRLPPGAVRKAALKACVRMARQHPSSGEYYNLAGVAEALIAVGSLSPSPTGPAFASLPALLSESHVGLEGVKQRFLEFCAVRQLAPDAPGPVLCLAGPPGVGKTSISKALARALGRPFVRVALGGVRDEASIRGHRRTYTGAMPGRLVEALIRAGVSDPVILLDEIDKMGRDPIGGDPSAALLEVLDSEQNTEFRDHFLGIGIDLSQAVFIATANDLDGIPGPLRDRMEVLELGWYSQEEKREAAEKHLIPRIKTKLGLGDRVVFSEATVSETVAVCVSDPGLRGLERALTKLGRQAAVRLVGEGVGHVTI